MAPRETKDPKIKKGPPFRGILEVILLFLQKGQQDLTNRSPTYLPNIVTTAPTNDKHVHASQGIITQYPPPA